MFEKLGIFLGRHSRATLVSGLILVVIAGVFGFGVFGRISSSKTDFANKSSESYKAYQQIEHNFDNNAGDFVALFSAKDGKTIDDPAVSRQIETLLAHAPKAVQVTSYFSTKQELFVSKDRTQTFASLALKNKNMDESQKQAVLDGLRNQFKGNLVAARVGGPGAIEQDVHGQVKKDLSRAERVSFIILAILLVFVFRSLVAAFVPLLLGGVSIIGAFFVTYILAGLTNISNYAINVIIMLGLGLAIDYSLFMVGRFREELRAGRPVADAVAVTVSTAGRTVFFSGLTVVLSLLGLLVFPLGFLRSIGLGGVAAVVVAMLAALIFLPAILYTLGRKVNALSFGSVRREHKAYAEGSSLEEKRSIWHKSGTFFMRRHWASIAVMLVVLVGIGLPFLRAQFAAPDYRSLPEGSEARIVSERLASDFHVPASPIQVLVTANALSNSQFIGAASQSYMQAISQIPGVTGVASVHKPLVLQASTGVSTAPAQSLITVSYNGAPEGNSAQQIVKDIRALPVPAAGSILVGGGPAELSDLLATIKHYIPYGLAVVVVTLFVLLFLMVGSVVLPLEAIAMNILSLSAAYGALVWIFQEGNLTGLLGLAHTPALDSTIPILIFAIAFGLSMDYSVFLYSRIKEAYDKTGDNEQAVLTGLQKTGSIITSASILLFVVVVAFATARIPLMQQIGVGLSITVLVDAFLVRMVLVPSLMKPLGRFNWWAPKPLKRLHERLGLGH